MAVDYEGGAVISTDPTAATPAWSATANIDGGEVLTSVSCPSTELCVAVDFEGYAVVGGTTGVTTTSTTTTTSEATTTTSSSTTTTSTTASTTTTKSEPPPPILTQREQASVNSGTITVRLKGKPAFEPFSSTATIPDGSEVEATNGHVLITVATPGGGTESAEVWGGRFLIHQERSGETRFTLTLPLTGCPRVKRPKGAAAMAKAKHGPKARHLWVSENGGSWGTNGRYVITTVVGTHWLTEDECNRSKVSVVSGKVRVRDLVNNRTRTLTAGQSDVAGRG